MQDFVSHWLNADIPNRLIQVLIVRSRRPLKWTGQQSCLGFRACSLWQSFAPSNSPSSRCSLQLPAAPEIFHGRSDPTEQAVTLLTANDQARVFVCGSGGIGKTSLALTVAHHPVVIKRFGKHRYWVPCEEAPTPGSFVLTVARSLKITIPPASADPFTDLIERFQAGEVVPSLLVLDNFETTWDTPQQAKVREILGTLASLEGVSILMTTRDADATVFGLSWSRPLLQPLGRLSLEASREAYLEHHSTLR